MEEDFGGFGFGNAAARGGEEGPRKEELNKKKADLRKLKIFYACFALGAACGFVGDFDATMRYGVRGAARAQ